MLVLAAELAHSVKDLSRLYANCARRGGRMRPPLRDSYPPPTPCFVNKAMRLRHYRPLNLLPSGSTVNMLSRFPALLIPTSNLRVIAAVCVQLKAVCGRYPLYVVFYYLTRPRIRR